MSSVSKVVLGNQTIMDITDSTVNANNLLSGAKAYGSDGEPVLGAVNLSDKADQVSIANVENNATASQAYSVGEFFYRNGDFCVVTASIASGAPLTENTNYVVTDLTSAIEIELAGKLDNSQATMGNYLVIERSTTTSADNSAILTFKTNDTDTGNTNYSRIYAYSPHTATGGNNLVMNAAGKLYIGSGESAKNLYDNHKSLGMSLINEYAYYLSDSHLYVLANGQTITDAKGFILTTGFNLTPYGFKTDVTPNAWGQLDNAGNIGTASYRWAGGNFVALNATTLNGQTIGSTPKFSDTTYTLSESIVGDAQTIVLTDSNEEPQYLTIRHWSDINKYDCNKVAIIENNNAGTSHPATRAYAKGEHFILFGYFCTAITDIAEGATLTENTNYKKEILSDYLTVQTKTASIKSGISWLTFKSNGNNCYRSGNHVSCQLYVNVNTAQSITSATSVITLPYTMYGRAKFGQINKSENSLYPVMTDMSTYIAANTSSLYLRGTVATGDYYISIDYLTTDPI